MSTSSLFIELGSSSSATMRKVADIADGFESDVYIEGTTAFVACGRGGLKAYDISDPNEPEFQGEYDEGYDFQSVWVIGDYAYVAAGLEGFIIIDVSNLGAMEITSRYDTPNSNEMAVEVEVDGDYAFLAYMEGGLVIYDISNPYNINFISDYDWVGVIFTEIDVNGSYVYAVNIYNSRFEVIDISNIYNPIKIGSYTDDVDYNHIYDICVVGDVVLASNSEDGLEIINVTDPHHPFEMANYTGDNVFGMCSDGQYAYLSCSSGLRTMNMTDPMNPTLESLVAISSGGEEMYLGENLACIICYEDGITFFDVSNPAVPSYMSLIDDAMISTDVSIEGNTAFLAGSEGICSIDIENPELPVVNNEWEHNYIQTVGSSPGFCYTSYLSTFYVIENSTMTSVTTLPTQSYPRHVIVEDPLALVISNSISNHFYTLINISDPYHPDILSETLIHRENFDFYGGAIEGDLLYLLGISFVQLPYTGIMYIFDITDPSNPVEITQYSTTLFGDDFCVVDNFVYLLSFDNGLVVLDVSVPGNPQVLGEYILPLTIEPYRYMNKITVVNDFAFIGTSKGIVILDVYDKENIELIEFYEDGSEFFEVQDIEFQGEYLYYTSYDDGLEIVEVKLVVTDRDKIPGYSIFFIVLLSLVSIAFVVKKREMKIHL